MRKQLVMKDHPLEIQNRVKEISNHYDERVALHAQFIWQDTEEGHKFWSEIDKGNYDVFYDVYGKEKCVCDKMFMDEWLHFDALDNIEVNDPEVISDSIVEKVIESFKERSNVGIKKYGVTLDRSDLSFLEWLNHLQTELQDAILYAERMKTTDGMSFSYDLEEIESMEMVDGKLIIKTIG